MHLFTTNCPIWRKGDKKESGLKSLHTDLDQCIPQKPEDIWDICKKLFPTVFF